MKLLIVEDELDLLNSTCVYLQKEDFICEPASNFFEAEDKLLSYNYDVVILDINLPDGNGLDLLKYVKEKSPETGVLIVSAKDSLDDKLKGLDLGASVPDPGPGIGGKPANQATLSTHQESGARQAGRAAGLETRHCANAPAHALRIS